MEHEIAFRHTTISPECLTMGEFLLQIVPHDMHLAIMAFGKEAATWDESGFDPSCWADHDFISDFLIPSMMLNFSQELKSRNILYNAEKLRHTIEDFVEHYYTKGFEMVNPNWREATTEG